MNKKNMILCFVLMFVGAVQLMASCCIEETDVRLIDCYPCGLVKYVVHDESYLNKKAGCKSCSCLMPVFCIGCCLSQELKARSPQWPHGDDDFTDERGSYYLPLPNQSETPVRGENPQAALVASLAGKCAQNVAQNNRMRSQNGILSMQLAAERQVQAGSEDDVRL